MIFQKSNTKLKDSSNLNRFVCAIPVRASRGNSRLHRWGNVYSNHGCGSNLNSWIQWKPLETSRNEFRSVN